MVDLPFARLAGDKASHRTSSPSRSVPQTPSKGGKDSDTNSLNDSKIRIINRRATGKLPLQGAAPIRGSAEDLEQKETGKKKAPKNAGRDRAG